jgi:hypothetical protein
VSDLFCPRDTLSAPTAAAVNAAVNIVVNMVCLIYFALENMLSAPTAAGGTGLVVNTAVTELQQSCTRAATESYCTLSEAPQLQAAQAL